MENRVEGLLAQVRLLSPEELELLIRQATELRERNLPESARPNYVSFLGSGRGAFSSPEEVDRFLREERDGWVR